MRWLGGGAAWLITRPMLVRGSAASGESPVCLFRPEQTEGPYFVDEELRRSDIRSDPTTGEVKPGVPLALTVALSRADHGVVSRFQVRTSTSGTAMRLVSIQM